MDRWQQEWDRVVESVADDVEQFCNTVSQDISDVANAFIEFSEAIAEQLQLAIAPPLDNLVDDLDDHLDEWVEPMLQAIAAIESTFMRVADPISHTVDPILNQHSVCIGCRHYHGQTYNDTMLVCAMHPYGMAEGVDTCSDKEPMSWAA